MANPEHLSLLRRGVKAWNKWRKENPKIKPDLSEADLREADLTEANLHRATLFGANLQSAILGGANLLGANLLGANLLGANLNRAILGRANLSRAFVFWASLREADLTEANLHKANLHKANLHKANLHKANLSETDLTEADLREADLTEADLYKANLYKANLYKANLREANLREADLREADLRETDLRETDLRETNLREVIFRATDTEWVSPQSSLVPICLETEPNNSRYFSDLQCSIYAPSSVQQDNSVMVQAFIHLQEQVSDVEKLATAFDHEAVIRGAKTLTPDLPLGTQITLHLLMPGLNIDEHIQSLKWQGHPTHVQFSIYALPQTKIGNRIGKLRILLDGIPIGSIKFILKVVADEVAETERQCLRTKERFYHYNKAFVSYASKDRPEVLKRVQMLKTLKISFFQDVLELEPGERWEKALYQHINESDLFLLFWSTAAKNSHWVLKEVRYAINLKCGDDTAPPDIIPVIIEGPPPVPPPTELAHLHFNDHLIYFMAAQEHCDSWIMKAKKFLFQIFHR